MKVFDMSSLDDLKPKVQSVEIEGTKFFVRELSASAMNMYASQIQRVAYIETNITNPAMAAKELNDVMKTMARICLQGGVVTEDGTPILNSDSKFTRFYENVSPNVTETLQRVILGARITDDEKKESGE
ncbi:hypothetical protein [Aeromonas taiwanensis]